MLGRAAHAPALEVFPLDAFWDRAEVTTDIGEGVAAVVHLLSVQRERRVHEIVVVLRLPFEGLTRSLLFLLIGLVGGVFNSSSVLKLMKPLGKLAF